MADGVGPCELPDLERAARTAPRVATRSHDEIVVPQSEVAGDNDRAVKSAALIRRERPNRHAKTGRQPGSQRASDGARNEYDVDAEVGACRASASRSALEMKREATTDIAIDRRHGDFGLGKLAVRRIGR
jgi:hypothetical protein